MRSSRASRLDVAALLLLLHCRWMPTLSEKQEDVAVDGEHTEESNDWNEILQLDPLLEHRGDAQIDDGP